MSVYRLLWLLLVHALHGRGRDEVCVAVEWDLPAKGRFGMVAGTATNFRWESDQDAFCMIEAVSEDGVPTDAEEAAALGGGC